MAITQQDIRDIIVNLIGGILVAGLIYFISWLKKLIRTRRLKKLFGESIILDEYYMVYGEMKPHEPKKPVYEVEGLQSKYWTPSVVSATTMKAIGIISQTISRFRKPYISIEADKQLKNKFAISYCAIGGNNNLTHRILNSKHNRFFKFEKGGLVYSISEDKHYSLYDNKDLGFIIKIMPDFLDSHVYIAVAGLGVWGTIGAAWYLSYKWKDIVRFAKSNEFGILVETEFGSYEKTKLISQFKA